MHETKIQLNIDDTHYEVHVTTMSGAQLKQLAGRDSAYQIYLEQPGSEDRLIADSEAVALKNGMHFYTVPPASFG